MIANRIRIAVPWLWLGMILAISFMEAPLKFTAPGITLPLGLGIGRIVFHTLNLMEWACWSILAGTCVLRKPTGIYLAYTAGVGLLLGVQTWILLPVLDERAVLIISGQEIPPSPWHWTYIAGDIVKAILLAILGWISTKEK